MKVKDIITTGIYTVLYFILMSLGTLIAVLLTHNPNMKFAPAITALLAGTVYMLLVVKVQKFGAVTLMAAVLGLFFLVSGHSMLAFIPSLLCGLLADVVAKLGRYQSKFLNLLSYCLFSLGNLAPIIMMWTMKQAYISQLLAKGKDMAYVHKVLINFDLGNASVLVGAILICAIVGGLFGQHLVSKHFKAAGLVWWTGVMMSGPNCYFYS